MAILCCGYACGILHKALYSQDWIIALYALNLVLVATDLALYYRYMPKENQVNRDCRYYPHGYGEFYWVLQMSYWQYPGLSFDRLLERACLHLPID